ncbi:hypothetical protein B0J17DRAFT_42194 [Rhizoctonia solani]|nr:hypothetical protein B0J17DRAFT_42194 [Rhizoctonia solani]
MTFTRSTTGCFVCKTKRKKCDETKPHCLRCQKSRIKCPGYTYIQSPNRPNGKPRTLQAPRTVVGRSQAKSYQVAPLASTKQSNLEEQDQPPLCYSQVTSDASSSVVDSSAVANAETSSEAIDFSAMVNTTYPNAVQKFPGTSMATSMTSGQASLLEALFSLGQPPDSNPLHQRPPLSTNSSPNTSVPTVYSWSPPDTRKQDDGTTHRDEDPEGVVSVVCRQLVLDKTAESNALPFLLQSYATWVRRRVLEPQKVASIAQDFVFSHFGDGDQSRLIIGLLGNIGSKMGSLDHVEGGHNFMLSTLYNVVRGRLRAVKSHPNPERSGLVKALGCTMETIFMYFYLGPLSAAMTLRQEAASIFRQLCHEPSGVPIALNSLLQHPLSWAGRYAHTDIVFSIVTDMPTLLRYKVNLPDSQPSNSDPSTQSDGIIQWIYGIPNQLILLLAKMKTMRQDGLRPNQVTVASLERGIRDLRQYNGSSSERFLAIIRFVVQECWRQAAYVYLYMAVCGDSSDTPRVQDAFKRYMKLLGRTTPGRLPDEFLKMTFHLVLPAALRKCDRDVIRQRVLGLFERDRINVTHLTLAYVTEDYWAQADAEGRPVVWSDLTLSRKRVLGA